ncbi:rod shape-determining protein MreC [Patiriisocius marinus]|nr:rod shape-determining protein MreC [Patiriisocius marinus]
MQQIINFFIKNKNFLLFAVLFFFSFLLTIQSHSFHNSKMVSSTNFFSGSLFEITSNINNYFHLKEQNEILADENSRLRNSLSTLKISEEIAPIIVDSTIGGFVYKGARVIKNSYSKTNNQLTINKGANDTIEVDMGVITSKGLVGIVNRVSANYGRIQSILNTNSQINAALKKSNHFGFLSWNGKNPNVVQLTEIPKLAPLQVGDTIITGGNSSIFPRGILVGRVENFSVSSEDTFIVDVKLFNDMTKLSHVYLIKNPNLIEIKNLEEANDNAE